ncbi:MAG: nucleotidyltransferase domain-containing protein [Anaerolineales bacterium]
MKEIILTKLSEIEAKEKVVILYTCESGSRAWGFPSNNSDYDIRFLYVRPYDWYLSIDQKRDVLEYKLEGDLDVNGWDLCKALGLFQKSNPPLFEWLNSPIKYFEKYSTAEKMRQLMPVYYSPIACAHHYLHMAQGNYREYLNGEQVWLKKYFYVLRPLLAIKWIESGFGPIPTEFGILVNRIIEDFKLKAEIEQLVNLKHQGNELAKGPRVKMISDFIDNELSRLESIGINFDSKSNPIEPLNDIFRDTLKEVWQSI